MTGSSRHILCELSVRTAWAHGLCGARHREYRGSATDKGICFAAVVRATNPQSALFMRKRIILRLGLLVIVAAVGFFLLVWGMAPDNFTTLERFAMLQGGESAEEVEWILGAPGIDRPGIPRALEGKVDVRDLLHAKEWRTPDGK